MTFDELGQSVAVDVVQVSVVVAAEDGWEKQLSTSVRRQVRLVRQAADANDAVHGSARSREEGARRSLAMLSTLGRSLALSAVGKRSCRTFEAGSGHRRGKVWNLGHRFFDHRGATSKMVSWTRKSRTFDDGQTFFGRNQCRRCSFSCRQQFELDRFVVDPLVADQGSHRDGPRALIDIVDVRQDRLIRTVQISERANVETVVLLKKMTSL